MGAPPLSPILYTSFHLVEGFDVGPFFVLTHSCLFLTFLGFLALVLGLGLVLDFVFGGFCLSYGRCSQD